MSSSTQQQLYSDALREAAAQVMAGHPPAASASSSTSPSSAPPQGYLIVFEQAAQVLLFKDQSCAKEDTEKEKEEGEKMAAGSKKFPSHRLSTLSVPQLRRFAIEQLGLQDEAAARAALPALFETTLCPDRNALVLAVMCAVPSGEEIFFDAFVQE